MKNKCLLFCCLAFCFTNTPAQNWISEKQTANAFTLVGPSQACTILVDEKDHWLVQKAAGFLQTDIEAVTGQKPTRSSQAIPGKNIVIIGSIDRSALIQELVKNKKLDITGIKDKWEAYQVTLINHPFTGIDKALVIVGNDRRGTAFGVFDISKRIGVSPLYWWADVPIKKKKTIYIASSIHILEKPAVKYRGIFINDESPAFSNWSKEKYGGPNHYVYEKVFELILRNKGNYLWPAMWGKAFADDDTLNPVLADQYGIVISNSHHEPMLRAQQEWKKYGKGPWNYQTNDTVLRAFWKKGIENMGTHESVVSIGMRGDGDMPMTQGSNIALLERIVADQRKIIQDVTGKPAAATPQSWALYKEVQDYYDKGMRVPDDVTLLLCDDNWGNIRKLPRTTDAPRKGGYGIYYHFDYVGGPRSYKWLNTNPIPRIWEQMHLAYEYNVRDIWVVNVGDIKPMEFPIAFFLDYAWNPGKIQATDIRKYTETWAADQFGEKYAIEIADILSKYAKYNGRRKPELLDANTYSILNYNELQKVTDDYNALFEKAKKIGNSLPPEYKDAFFQLVLHPVQACSNLQNLYTAVAYNRWLASQHSIAANRYADQAKQYFINDSLISKEYNSLANGKWNHMMDQTHIGYTLWSDPPFNRMPALKYVPADSAQEPIIPVKAKTISSEKNIPSSIKNPAFYELNGYFSIDADHYSNVIHSDQIHWQVLPDHGRTGSAITSMPVTAAAQIPGANSPHLEYEVYTYDTGICKLQLFFSPTLNFHNDDGLKYAISVDDETPQIVSINSEDNNTRIWEEWMRNNIITKTTVHRFASTGRHLVKYWMVSPAIVLQKIVGNLGGLQPSYLGPPETKFINIANK